MTKEGVDLRHPETTDVFPRMVYSGEPTLGTNETTARRGSKTNTEREPAKRANETTANAEQPKPKATQKTKPQPTPNPRPMQEALDSIDRGPPPRPRVQVSLVRVRVSVGRCVWWRLRLILSFVRVMCCFWTLLLAVVSFYLFVGSP